MYLQVVQVFFLPNHLSDLLQSEDMWYEIAHQYISDSAFLPNQVDSWKKWTQKRFGGRLARLYPSAENQDKGYLFYVRD